MATNLKSERPAQDAQLLAVAGLLAGYPPPLLVELSGEHFDDATCGLAWDVAEFAWNQDGVSALEIASDVCGPGAHEPLRIEVVEALMRAETLSVTKDEFERACADVKEQAFYVAVELATESRRSGRVKSEVRTAMPWRLQRRNGCGMRQRFRGVR